MSVISKRDFVVIDLERFLDFSDVDFNTWDAVMFVN